MRTPAISFKLKKIRRRFGVSAPRMVIRSHVPWQIYLLGGALVLLLFAALLVLSVQYWSSGGLGRELLELRDRLDFQHHEIEGLRATSGTAQSVANIEHAAYQNMLARLQFLEQENAALKEDMLLFEQLVPSPEGDMVLRIENFRITRESAGYLRYRLLLVRQGGRSGGDFRGNLQFSVVYSIDGQSREMLVPDVRRSDALGYGVELTRFLRREGVLDIPPRAQIAKVEARLLQGNVVRAKAEVQL